MICLFIAGLIRLCRLNPHSIILALKLLNHVLAELQPIAVVADTGSGFRSRHVCLTINFLEVAVHAIELLHEEVVQAALFGDFTCAVELGLSKVFIYIDMRLLALILM